MDKLERIDALLELDVLIGELGLIFNLSQLLLDHLLGALRKWREARAIRTRDRQESVSERSTAVQNGVPRGCFLRKEGVAFAMGPLEVGRGGYAHLKVLPNACTRSMIVRYEGLKSWENTRKKCE